MNDSAEAMSISQLLVDIATLLYTPQDTQARDIEDQHEISATPTPPDDEMEATLLLEDVNAEEQRESN